MKKELIIKQKGLFLRLTGIAPFRTPAKVDISRLNVTLLLSELNMNSVIDFQIISNSKEEKESKKEKSTSELIENLKIDKKENINKNNIDVKKELIEIKYLLQNLLEKPSTVIEKVYESNDKIETKKSKREKKISDDFIPSVNISNLEMKKGSEINTITSDEDISDSVDLLSRISKKRR